MNAPEAWTPWRDAEAQLAAGASLDVASAALTPRQAALLRALAALDNGDRTFIAAEAEATPFDEVRAILELTLEEPARIDPTAMRSALKRESVTNEPFPRLDLVRILAVALQGRAPQQQPSALAQASRTRPALDSALDVFLARRFSDTTIFALDQRSPRLRATFSAAIGLVHGQIGPLRQVAGRVALDHDVPEGALDPSRWPKVGHAEIRPVPRLKELPAQPKKDPLLEFLRAPTKKPWSMACNQRVEAAARAPKAEARLTLGRLLVAAHTLASGPRPIAASPVIQAAARLAHLLPTEPNLTLLQLLLHEVTLRLNWWSEEERAESLEWVLHVLAPLPVDVSRSLAQELLTIAQPGVTDPYVAQRLLLLHLRHPGALTEEGLEVVAESATLLSQRELEDALRPVDPVRRGLLSAAYSFGRGQYVRASAEVLEGWLALDPSALPAERRAIGAAAMSLFNHIVTELTPDTRRSGGERRRLAAALTHALAASMRGELQASLSFHADITVVLALVEPREGLDEYRQWLRPQISEVGPASEAALAPECFVLTHFTADAEGGDRRMKALGRWLRETPTQRAVPFALRWVARMASDPRCGDAQWKRWLAAVSVWLSKQPLDEVGRHALSLGRQDLGLGTQLIVWATEHNPDAFENGAWCELEDFVRARIDGDGEAPGPALDAMMAELDGMNPKLAESMLEDIMASFGFGPLGPDEFEGADPLGRKPKKSTKKRR